MLDFSKIIRENTDVELRTQEWVRLLEILSEPLFRNRDEFEVWKSDVLFELELTPMLCDLEYYLNRRFDPELKRIRIIEDDTTSEFDYFLEEAQQHEFDYFISENVNDGKYNYFVTESNASFEEDFLIKCPEEIKTSYESQIFARVKRILPPTIIFRVTN